VSGHHRLLARQLRRHLRAVDPGAVPGLSRFLEAVDAAYCDHDDDRRQLERAMDISSQELMETTEELRAVIASLPDEFLLLGPDGRVLDHNPGQTPVLPAAPSPLGRPLTALLCPEGARRFAEALAAVAEEERQVIFEYSPQDAPDHAPLIFEVRVFPLHGGRVVSLLRNVSERRAAERRIAHLAFHDSLTGLPNRLRFHQELDAGLERARADEHRLAVLFLDVDRFKSINDTFGHAVGDQLLVTLAQRLQRAVELDARTVALHDPHTSGPATPEDGERPALIARMGGDEFTVLLPLVAAPEEGERLCRRIMEEVCRPVVLDGIEVVTSFSVGLSVFPDHGSCAESLLKNADAAMYHAKASGRANAQTYQADMNTGACSYVQMESALRQALRSGALELHYQPILCATSGATTSLEALARWTDPELGRVPPSVFVALAEESDLILELGSAVVDGACAQVRRWLDAGFAPPRVSVNLSARHFATGEVVQEVALALDRHSLTPEHLGIELTETAMVEDTARTRAALDGLRELGVRISMDDFGTGFSSLALLKTIPVDLLKIDRSFVRDIGTDPDDTILIRAIIAMGHGLGLSVVAEGVETEDQLRFLRQQGCDHVQGYLHCRPGPAEQVRRFVEAQRSSAAQQPRASADRGALARVS
jgi:predicted signal transduction protein with EAL and GGDEF domain